MAEKGGRRGRASTRSSAPKKKTASKKKKSSKAAKPAGPKATKEDLEKHLGELADDVREVVVRRQGMAGHDAASVADVAAALDIPEEDVSKRERSGLFKLRMAFGKARKENQDT